MSLFLPEKVRFVDPRAYLASLREARYARGQVAGNEVLQVVESVEAKKERVVRSFKFV